jgi:DNA-binding MltR family transcriptional regulator
MNKKTEKPKITTKTRIRVELHKGDTKEPPDATAIQFVDEELIAAFDEVNQQTDRGCAIILTAIVDDYLRQLLIKRLRPLSKSEVGDLFDAANAPLSSFAAKIDLGFALGLYRRELKDSMHAMRRIRNRFAHQIAPLTFSSASIKEKCGGPVSEIPYEKGEAGRKIDDLRGQFYLSGFVATILFKILLSHDISIQKVAREVKALHEGNENELLLNVVTALAAINREYSEKLFSERDPPAG